MDIGRGLASLLVWLSFFAQAAVIQPQVDQALLQIFSTETGRKALCSFAENPKYLALYIGNSPGISVQLKNNCGRAYTNPVYQHLVMAMSSVAFRGDQPSTKGKAYTSMGLQAEYKGIGSYTNKENKTFFMMSDKEMAGAGFLRALAHEMAMSYDQLSRAGYLVDPTTWAQGVNAAYAQPVYGESVFTNTSENVREISCALRDPAIRYALATERAFRFEDQIIAELGLKSPSVASGSFREAITRYIRLYEQFRKIIAWESMKYEAACGKLATSRTSRDQQISRRLAVLEDTVLQFRGSRKTIKLSDLMTEPHVGPFMPDLDGGGPRPRMGGWGD